MKRMYVTLLILVLAIGWALTGLGQKHLSPPKPLDQEAWRMQRRMELRAEMHRRMMDKLLRGVGPDQDMFKDMEKMFEDSMGDAFSHMDSLVPQMSNFQMEWSENSAGRILTIIPQDKNQNLDIDVKPEMVTIKGKKEVKSANGSAISDFSNTFPVPEDCDGSRVKIDQKDGKIVMNFPYKAAKAIGVPKPVPHSEPDRKPLPPSDEEITI